MGRKNVNAVKSRRQRKLPLAKNTHLMYNSTDYEPDTVVVRYLGEQSGDSLLCYHPEGYALWCHMSHLWRNSQRAMAA